MILMCVTGKNKTRFYVFVKSVDVFILVLVNWLSKLSD